MTTTEKIVEEIEARAALYWQDNKQRILKGRASVIDIENAMLIGASIGIDINMKLMNEDKGIAEILRKENTTL